MPRRKCCVCPKLISAERLQLRPNAVTCSPACAKQHQKNLVREAVRRHRERKREAAG